MLNNLVLVGLFFFFLHSLGCFFSLHVSHLFSSLSALGRTASTMLYKVVGMNILTLSAILESICSSTIKHDVSSRFFVDILYHVEKVPFYL